MYTFVVAKGFIAKLLSFLPETLDHRTTASLTTIVAISYDNLPKTLESRKI